MIAKLFAAPAMKIAAGFQILSIAAIIFLLLAKAAETRRADKLQVRLTETQAAFDKTVSDYRQLRAEQKAADEKHAREVEATQTKVSNEVSSEYQARLAALRARYDSLRKAAPSADPGGAERKNVPGISSTPSGPDAAASDYAFRCEADAIQLISLQEWVRGQVGVER